MFDFTTIKKSGKEFIQIPEEKAEIKFNTTRLFISFENLFNGDKLLGEYITNQW